MNRREVLTLLGAAGAAWPVGARGQQGERVRRIGVLMPGRERCGPSDPPRGVPSGAEQLGWIIGRNVRIDTRWATTNAADIRRHVAELVALTPDVILAHGTTTVGPLLQATRTVPIVFPVVGDPVGRRLRRQPCAAGRQRHRLHRFRIRHEPGNGWNCSSRSRRT